MFKKTTVLCFMSFAITSYALTTQSFRDNTDLNVSLSDSNYNRLVVRGDKITQAHFPEGRMAIKNEVDGSLYVMVGSKEPFTLFLTTESGHHFSVTVNTEQSLGKTIEFISQTPVVARIASAQDKVTQVQNLPGAQAITALMTSMIKTEQASGFELHHHYGKVIRLQRGLILTPKITYTGLDLKGEVMEIYNGSTLPQDLMESWFTDKDVKAVSLSLTTLAPKQKAYLYRISEQAHG
jgi:conjugal transfer pilus assembly protein TraK